MMPDGFKLVPTSKGRDQLRIVTGLMNRKDVSEIVCATDADREGELIFRYIYRISGSRKPVQRLWLSETTPVAIQKALRSMKPGSAYDSLGQAAELRSQADWLVGLNATRAFTLRHGVPGQGALSVGRVQTPTLRLIADRDQAIAQFAPVPFWEVAATFDAAEGTYVAKWTDPTQKEHPERIANEPQAKALAAKVPAGTPGKIQTVETKRVTVNPPLLFSLNDLQKEANKRLGLTAQQTLDSAQSLYEKHLTSYPRTESRYITSDVADTLSDRLKGLRAAFGSLIDLVPNPLNPTRITDDKKVEGHHGILPTGQVPHDLSDREKALYDLILRRFIASLMPAGEDERTEIVTAAGGETFLTQGTAVLSPGWRSAFPSKKNGEDEENPRIPPGLSSGESVRVQTAKVLEKSTKAPPALNDSSLLGMREKHGLGTAATRARILEVLLTREYIVRQKKTLVTTEKGRAVLAVVPDAIQSPALTGEWEAQLEAIADGRGRADEFMKGIREYTQEIVEAARGQASQAIGTDLGFCPACGKGRILSGKKAWGCSRWREGCKFTVWKEVSWKKLTEMQVKTILSGKVTPEIKGFKSKSGKPFSAKLKLAEGKVQFVFGDIHHAKKMVK